MSGRKCVRADVDQQHDLATELREGLSADPCALPRRLSIPAHRCLRVPRSVSLAGARWPVELVCRQSPDRTSPLHLAIASDLHLH